MVENSPRPNISQIQREMIITERRAAAVRLRKAGASYRAIARALGTDTTTAFRDVEAVLTELSSQTLADARELVAMECERLDALQCVMWPRALKGDIDAADVVLKIMVRRANLLGLDAGKLPSVYHCDTPKGGMALLREVRT